LDPNLIQFEKLAEYSRRIVPAEVNEGEREKIDFWFNSDCHFRSIFPIPFIRCLSSFWGYPISIFFFVFTAMSTMQQQKSQKKTQKNKGQKKKANISPDENNNLRESLSFYLL